MARSPLDHLEVRVLITNHVLCGAAIGAAVGQPAAALPLGVASHFALDALPHWGRWESEQHFLRVAVADGLVGLGAMAAAYALAPRGRRGAVLAGMVGAALPDLDKPSRIFFGFSPFPARVDAFHGRIQDEAPGRFYSHEVVAGVLFGAVFAAVGKLKASGGARGSAAGGARYRARS